MARMTTGRLQRLFLWLFLGFLSATAVLAVGIVLLGDMSDTKGRILATSGTISVASIAAMTCAAFRGRARRRWVGGAGIALCLAAGTAIVVATWAHGLSQPFEKLLGCLVTAAGLTTLGVLLWLWPLAPRYDRVQRATSLSIALLALLICGLILLEPEHEALVRGTIAVAIVVALQTLAHPILWKLGARDGAREARRLLLTQQADDTWTDEQGRRYAVRPLEPEPGS
jgi:MFS family permease